jgi:hypothetical protein
MEIERIWPTENEIAAWREAKQGNGRHAYMFKADSRWRQRTFFTEDFVTIKDVTDYSSYTATDDAYTFEQKCNREIEG